MTQDYSSYTAQDHQIWAALYERQQMILPEKATPEFFDGLRDIGFDPHYTPNFDKLNAQLAKLTGWQLVAVPGIVDDAIFFGLLEEKKFPATTWMRKPEELDYIEEPDMFHDVFGHIPLLSNQAFTDFLQGLGTIGLKHVNNPLLVELLARLYWFTVEFGLIQGEDGLRIYGAGILSSVAETSYSLGELPERHPFDVQQIMATPFFKDRFQQEYFVIQSFTQLYESLPEVANVLAQVAQVAAEKEPVGV